MAEETSESPTHAAVAIATELLRSAGTNPNVQAAAGEIGKTVLTLTKTINNALLPIAAVNFAFDKARAYFANQFEAEFTRVAGSIPVEDLIEPKPMIAGPALQGLAFCHEEDNLRALYLALLATAVDRRKAASAHPAFVEIIRQMDSEEARLIQTALRSEGAIAIAQLIARTVGSISHRPLQNHIINFRDMSTQEPVEEPKMPAMIDNWIRLGLVTVEYDKSLTSDSAYSWVDGRPEFKREAAKLESGKEELEFNKGVLLRTSFGKQFGRACGILESE